MIHGPRYKNVEISQIETCELLEMIWTKEFVYYNTTSVAKQPKTLFDLLYKWRMFKSLPVQKISPHKLEIWPIIRFWTANQMLDSRPLLGIKILSL